MGFNKRWVNKESLLVYYKRDGLKGVKQYFRADALFVKDDFTSDVLTLLNEGKEDEIITKLDNETL